MPAETPAKTMKPASGPAIRPAHLAAGRRMRCSNGIDDGRSYTAPKSEAISPDEQDNIIRRRKGGRATALPRLSMHDHAGEHVGLRHHQEADQAGERDGVPE